MVKPLQKTPAAGSRCRAKLRRAERNRMEMLRRYLNCKVYQRAEKEENEFDFFPERREPDIFQFTGYMNIETYSEIDHKYGDKVWINRNMYVII